MLKHTHHIIHIQKHYNIKAKYQASGYGTTLYYYFLDDIICDDETILFYIAASVYIPQ